MSLDASINFLKGHHSVDLFPGDDRIAKAYAQILRSDSQFYDNIANVHPLTYGTSQGNRDVRETIAKWIGSHYGRIITDPNTINLTAGASYVLIFSIQPQTQNRFREGHS